ncbi:hypothetical protein ABZY44_29255 [Streptomyces sp. NPDC006544]|uniref:hypothetical protein n=1 Tax=Streptomyces sp. NPDC006544 TaxID=3154583 RepID=UPI0033B3D2AE
MVAAMPGGLYATSHTSRALQRYATLAEAVHAVAVPATPVFDFANGAACLFDGGPARQLRSQAIERPPEDLGVG